MDLTFQVPRQCCPLQLWTLLSPPDTHNRALFLLWHSHFVLSVATSDCPPLFPSSISDILPAWGADLPVSHHCAFSCCSWGSCSKKAGVVGHFLLQWTTFCQSSPLWPIHLGWASMAWLRASLSSGLHTIWYIHRVKILVSTNHIRKGESDTPHTSHKITAGK